MTQSYQNQVSECNNPQRGLNPFHFEVGESQQLTGRAFVYIDIDCQKARRIGDVEHVPGLDEKVWGSNGELGQSCAQETFRQIALG